MKNWQVFASVKPSWFWTSIQNISWQTHRPLNVSLLWSTQLSEATGVIAIININVSSVYARYVVLHKCHTYSQPLGISPKSYPFKTDPTAASPAKIQLHLRLCLYSDYLKIFLQFSRAAAYIVSTSEARGERRKQQGTMSPLAIIPPWQAKLLKGKSLHKLRKFRYFFHSKRHSEQSQGLFPKSWLRSSIRETLLCKYWPVLKERAMKNCQRWQKLLRFGCNI